MNIITNLQPSNFNVFLHGFLRFEYQMAMTLHQYITYPISQLEKKLHDIQFITFHIDKSKSFVHFS